MHLNDLRRTVQVFPNGLRVVCVEQPALHTVGLTLHIRVGSRFESFHSNGCSHVLEHMLFRGTPSYPSAHELAFALQGLGGTLYAATHVDHGVMSLALPPECLDQAFSIFAEIATQPIFRDLEVERGIIREEILESLDEHDHQVDPDNLSRDLMYGPHPLGRPITGSLDTIERFQVEELREHHQRHYTGSNTVLSFAGAIDSAACFEAAHRGLGAIAPGCAMGVTSPPFDQREPRFRFVENQSSQTELRLAFRAPGELDPAEPAAEVLVRLLDDGMATRLYARICDEKGLCYDVSSDYETYEDDGVLDLAAAVQHSRALDVTKELAAVVGDLARNGPTEEELRICKARHHWEIRALLDDADGLADFHGITALAGISDTPQQRDREIGQVTRDQIVEVARRIFRPEYLSAVAVGLLEPDQERAIEDAVAAFRFR